MKERERERERVRETDRQTEREREGEVGETGVCIFGAAIQVISNPLIILRELAEYP
jgi:hypothetical protein